MLTPADLIPLSPFLVVAGASILLLLLTAFDRHHALTLALTLIALSAALAIVCASSQGPVRLAPLLIIDGPARCFMGLIFAATLGVVLLASDYLEDRPERSEEFYALLLMATLGAAVLAASRHFASFFLGLEILSLALYALIAYRRVPFDGIEASLKYVVLAGVSSAFLLFGMALVYAATGSMEFGRFSLMDGQNLIGLSGMGLIVIGVGFKLAVVPFHFWAPDIYEGAPAPVAAYVATVSKGAVFALALRFFLLTGLSPSLRLIFAIIAIASMIMGNVLALLQNNVKRLLAYSSIAHLGYLLVAFLAGGKRAIEASAFYLTAYVIAMLGAFGIIMALSNREREADRMEDYRGLFWRRPWLAGSFTAVLLSLAGIPLTAGFVANVYLLLAGVGSALWALVIVLVLSSTIGLFYYLRVIIVMYEQPARESLAAEPLSVGLRLAITGLVLALFWVGVYPAPLVNLVQKVSMR